ncbi:uncharacterized protein LOC108917697 isoform X2 [Anoplophora glabripennis]|uniref:uncharacterized protein LOC108917697 isoform X2 n=1 Tax=Anoplophora glabripennis TaxID=217634 RepID=UPI000C76302A|nr:uncharacterized protein LOC108917697 isoform X2 [Anoplophora glabripennis]
MTKYPIVILLGCLFIFFDVLEVASISINAVASLLGQISDRIECKLPPYPQHGKWKLAGGKAKPGDTVLESSVIVFECDVGYKLSSKIKHLYCDEDWDSIEIPECEESCPKLYSSTIYDLKCTDKKGNKIKCSEATNGTFLEYNCAPFYETPFGYRKTFLCQNKKWDQKPVCLPVCGKKITDDTKTLIYGSKPNDKLEYPWVAALYIKIDGSYENICGGSILSATVLLTAAHCVTNEYGDVMPADKYAVGAGKLFNKYEAPEDDHAQYLQVSKIIVSEDYKADRRRFLADIAVLVTNGEFIFSEVIQPVCFNNVKNIHLHPGSIGEISGWGLSEGEVASDVLRTLKIPYKYEATCAAELPRDWSDKYNMADKICTGFVDQNTSVCDGDSGNGLAFQNPEDNRYYIHGLVSLGPKKDYHCDIQQNTLYTRVAYYYQFVDNLLSRYNPEIKDCKLPAHPKNGKWTTKKKGMKPGDVVPSSIILTVRCNVGYTPSSRATSVECGSTYYMPTCQKLCSTPNFPKGTFSQCTNGEGQAIHCSEAVDGTTLSYLCPVLYQSAPGTTNVRTCVKGSWEPSQPECVRITKQCGKATTSGDTAQKGLKYPWTAGVYKFHNSTEEKYKYICGASIISKNAVLTAAQCVTDNSGDILSRKNYLVAAGQVYAKYNDSRDVQAQYKEVSHIVIHPYYKPAFFHPGDIAILFVNSPFTLNAFVQPVCFPNRIDKMLQIGDKGMISGWALEETENFYEPDALEVTFTEKNICDEASYARETINTQDKICVSFSNDSLCLRPDDVGKGFYYKNPEDGRYYIHGIANIASDTSQEKCMKKVLLTETLSYYDFLDCVLSKFSR